VNEATQAARKMMELRGYVVVGMKHDAEMIPAPGIKCLAFAGMALQNALLILTEPTDRKDWDAQMVYIFGDKTKNRSLAKKLNTASFWRAKLEVDVQVR
jgi:hypothetical protein